MKRPKVLLGLLVTLALTLFFVMSVPGLAQPTFTGDVETDFTGPGVLTFVDLGGKDVLVPNHPIPGTSSGWDIKDVRLVYDSATDILYVGLNSYETVGDADTDGNEGGMSYDSGVDVPNLGVGESVSVYFDLNQDGNWDVIAGVPDTTNFSGFTVKAAIGTTPNIAVFGASLTTGYNHLDPTPYWIPASAPDFEFRILNFSHLPNQGGELGAFTIGAFMGSWADVSIIEDAMVGSTSPAINIVKKTNGTDNNSAPGPYIAAGAAVTWTYNVTNPGTVPLSNVTVIDSVAGVNPAYVSGDTGNVGFLDPSEAWIYQASGSATVGQYSNTGNATGYSNGFPVSDTDPDYYTGVDVRISISPLGDDNEVGTNHILTITLEKSVVSGVWTPLAGETVTASLSNSDGATAAFVGPSSGSTNSSGQFDVTISSPTAGSTTIWADWAGGTMEGATVTAKTTDPDADKDWVAVRISISPLEGDNEVNTDHVLTILLEKSVAAGVWTPLAGQTVTASLSNSGGATAAFVGSNSGTTSASGQFNVTIKSLTPGSTTIWADWVGGTVEGAVITARTTNPDANKDWVGASIRIEKSTNGQDANSPTGPYIPVGGVVTWTYNVTNYGSVNLTDIVVTDDHLGVISGPVSGDDGSDGILEPYSLTGEAWLYQATGFAAVGQYSNIGNVTGTTPEQYLVSASDPSHYLGVKARITISPLEDTNRVGEEHVLNATVYVDTGSGYAPYLEPVTINFSKIGVGNLSATSVPTSTGWAQTILTSDVAGNSTVTAQCSFTVGGAGGTSFNISTDGTGDNSGPAKKTWGVLACIHIVKTTNGADGLPIPEGAPVTWVYNVTNCGDVPLSSINVTDSEPGVTPFYQYGDANNNTQLDLTEAWIYQATGTAIAGYYTNIGHVTGRTPEQDLVSNSDPSNYYNRLPVGWETYPVNKLRVLLPWIGLVVAIIAGASLLVLRRRRPG